MRTYRIYGCFLSCIYIKPQHEVVAPIRNKRCFLSCIYIKPQPVKLLQRYNRVVSYLVSTSNHNLDLTDKTTLLVVSYLVSTSNHNSASPVICLRRVVSYLVSTSNHNFSLVSYLKFQLFLILYLHQTTTSFQKKRCKAWLFLILYLHQTTTYYSR